MSDTTIVLERMKKKEAEIQGLEEKLRIARVYLQALQDILRDFENEGKAVGDGALRQGSSVTLARDAIIKAGKPLHMSDLLSALGKGITKEARASLGGSLSAYVRRGEIFNRPSPNTFGLIEMGHSTQSTVTLPDEPPDDFGSAQAVHLDDEIPF